MTAKLIPVTDIDVAIAQVAVLNTKLSDLSDQISQAMSALASAQAIAAAQASDYSTLTVALAGVDADASTADLSESELEKADVDTAVNAAASSIVEAGTWINQYKTLVSQATARLDTIKALAQSCVETVSAHTELEAESVHGKITVLSTPYVDSAGDVIARSSLALTANGIALTVPADPNIGGPPQYPRFVCGSGAGLGRVNSYAGSDEGQPEAQWTSCAVSGDSPYKYIWQFRTSGTSAWKDFAIVGNWVNTGHDKINKVQTVMLSTPYWTGGDSAWTTATSSTIKILPSSQSSHGITKIFDVRCMVVSEATVWINEASLSPSYGYAVDAGGTMYSEDKTDSFMLATALCERGYMSCSRKQSYFRTLRAYVRGPYQLSALKGYHALVPPLVWILDRTRTWNFGLRTWSFVVRTAEGKGSFSDRLIEAAFALVGFMTGGRKEYRKVYTHYQHGYGSTQHGYTQD